MNLNQDNQHSLDNNWTIWYHDPNDKRWSSDSYDKLAYITTIEEFLTHYESIDSFTSGMFFLMKDDIPPIWEDPNNIKGGILTYKILKTTSDNIWNDLSMMLIGGSLSDDYTYINGISISPKINNCIIKIWIKDATKINSITFNKESELIKNYSPIHKIFG